MKKLILIALSVACTHAFAKNIEGLVRANSECQFNDAQLEILPFGKKKAICLGLDGVEKKDVTVGREYAFEGYKAAGSFFATSMRSLGMVWEVKQEPKKLDACPAQAVRGDEIAWNWNGGGYVCYTCESARAGVVIGEQTECNHEIECKDGICH